MQKPGWAVCQISEVFRKNGLEYHLIRELFKSYLSGALKVQCLNCFECYSETSLRPNRRAVFGVHRWSKITVIEGGSKIRVYEVRKLVLFSGFWFLFNVRINRWWECTLSLFSRHLKILLFITDRDGSVIDSATFETSITMSSARSKRFEAFSNVLAGTEVFSSQVSLFQLDRERLNRRKRFF